MEPRILNRKEFIERYWKYYLILEKNFLDVEQYLAIDEINYSAFSNEYIKQYQTICSEIDAIAKSYCREIDNKFRGGNINKYRECIVSKNNDFANRKIILIDREITVSPWEDWNCTKDKLSNQNENIKSNNPDWWNKYNNIKHRRTTINDETKLPYYKLANQKNVIYSLAALFQLEMYYYRLLWEKQFQSEPDIPDPPSKLFMIENWESKWLMLGEEIFGEVVDR